MSIAIMNGLATPPKPFAQLVDRRITEVTENDLAGVDRIGTRAFNACSSLKYVILPASVVTIYNEAFGNCTALTKMVMLRNKTVDLNNTNVFTGTTNCRFYVYNPDTVRTANNWSNLATRIFPLVDAVADLSNIDTTAYTRACVMGTDKSYKIYTYDGSQWNEVT